MLAAAFVSLAAASLSGPAVSADAGPPKPQTYDCQARITRPEALPPVQAGKWPLWRCRAPRDVPHSTAQI